MAFLLNRLESQSKIGQVNHGSVESHHHVSGLWISRNSLGEMPEEEIERLTNRVMSYVAKVRLPDIEGIEVRSPDFGFN